MKANNFLKVTGILMIIGGAIGIIIGIIAVLGLGALAAMAGAGAGGIGALLVVSVILVLISPIIQLIAGILGVKNAAKPEKQRFVSYSVSSCLYFLFSVLFSEHLPKMEEMYSFN